LWANVCTPAWSAGWIYAQGRLAESLDDGQASELVVVCKTVYGEGLIRCSTDTEGSYLTLREYLGLEVMKLVLPGSDVEDSDWPAVRGYMPKSTLDSLLRPQYPSGDAQ